MAFQGKISSVYLEKTYVSKINKRSYTYRDLPVCDFTFLVTCITLPIVLHIIIISVLFLKVSHPTGINRKGTSYGIRAIHHVGICVMYALISVACTYTPYFYFCVYTFLRKCTSFRKDVRPMFHVINFMGNIVLQYTSWGIKFIIWCFVCL